MKPISPLRVLLPAMPGWMCCSGQSATGLKNGLKGKFLLGTALNVEQIRGNDKASADILSTRFNSAVAENCMKAARLQPREGEFDFEDADRCVRLGEELGMFIVGHTSIGHSGVPEWFFVDAGGREVSREVWVERMRDRIFTVIR